MTFRKFFLLAITWLLTTQISSGQWVNRYDGQGDFSDLFNAIAKDASGNIYLAGSTMNTDRNSDILVIKMSAVGDTLWTSVIDGPGKDRDEAQAITVDNSGNVYATGFIKGATGYDFITIKYNSTGVIQWTATYTFTTDQTDQAVDIKVDGSGNVFVAGYSDKDGTALTDYDYVVIKYNSSGAQQWVTRKDGVGNGDDRPSKLVLDASGNPIITGRTFNGTDDDYLTVKLNGSNGAQAWQQVVDRTHNDRATDIALNTSNGNIYVTGRSKNLDFDYLTICYNSSGTQQWQAIYNNVDDDKAAALGLDGSGNVYVTGQSDADATAGTNFNLTTVKYNSQGVQQWVKSYNGAANNNEEAMAVAIDGSGNCVVLGSTDTNPGADSTFDYVTISYAANGNVNWTSTFSSSSATNDIPAAMVIDGSGNVIVTGASAVIPQRDGATVKYNSSGTSQWTKYYNGIGDHSDNGYALAVDGNKNVFVAGYTVQYDMDRNFALQKIDANGFTSWIRTLDGTVAASGDQANGVAIDGSGNIFVGGYTHNSGQSNDFTVAKYNQNGDSLWTRIYNYPAANESDRAISLTTDGSGNVYLTGRSDSDPSLASNDDILVVKWDGSGNFQWAQRFNGSGNSSDAARMIKISSSGNLYVVGRTTGTASDYVLLKYNTAGALQWSKTYDGGGADDATALVIDNSENIYITGFSEGALPGDTDVVTLKYNAAGLLQWTKRYNGAGHGSDKADGIAIDGFGHIVIAGSSDADSLSNTRNTALLALAYDASGNQQWANNFSAIAGGNNEGTDVAVDAQGNSYVCGWSENAGNADIIILKFLPNGTLADTSNYNGPANGNDFPNQIITNGNDVYVVGNSAGAGNSQRDVVTIKYANGILGIKEVRTNSAISISPNPMKERATVYTSISPSQFPTLSVSITNVEGQIVRQFCTTSVKEFTIDRSDLITGIYQLNLSNGSYHLGSIRFVVQ